MEYISAEEFLKQPKEVREVFLDWWKPSVGDLIVYKNIFKCVDEVQGSTIKALRDNSYILKSECIHLFTEGQLRHFIEDKTTDKLITHYRYGERKILLYDESIDEYSKIFNNTAENLLQAYWKVALEIAKGEVEYGKH